MRVIVEKLSIRVKSATAFVDALERFCKKHALNDDYAFDWSGEG